MKTSYEELLGRLPVIAVVALSAVGGGFVVAGALNPNSITNMIALGIGISYIIIAVAIGIPESGFERRFTGEAVLGVMGGIYFVLSLVIGISAATMETKQIFEATFGFAFFGWIVWPIIQYRRDKIERRNEKLQGEHQRVKDKEINDLRSDVREIAQHFDIPLSSGQRG